MKQHTLMKFDPATGAEKPYPSHAEQWRKHHGVEAWLFNPWTGTRRLAGDVGTDVFGLLVVPPGEPLYASSAPLEFSLIEPQPCCQDWNNCGTACVCRANYWRERAIGTNAA